MFGKQAMEEELIAFISAYTASTNRMFGTKVLDEIDLAKRSPLFKVCSDMYAYAFEGVIPDPAIYQMGDAYLTDATVADAEMFLRGIEKPDLYTGLYYQEDDVRPPKMAIQTIRAAVARHVLDGGARYTGDLEREDYGSGASLSFKEVALLADMGEKSVRNAANPKNKEPLITNSRKKTRGLKLKMRNPSL
ncbi:hypothetical protein [Diaphorobacter sp.]|uniref:hypothetical protein n=1 Tax=Diaphorobacter sp. TaxID=1934310 RepID=UPI0028AAF1B4|nr:hypothetical protein [Diaphorobacter sp.]